VPSRLKTFTKHVSEMDGNPFTSSLNTYTEGRCIKGFHYKYGLAPL
jgi:hypothetical protein